MRPTSPDRGRGFTLVEGIVVLVITAILAVMATFFVAPLQQSLDVVTRADLTDTADTALQRIGREAQLALPNSVRVTSDIPGNRYLEFLAVRTAGRYRGDTGGANANVCPADGSGLGTPGSDQLSFDVSDGCFKTVGKIPNPAVGARDYLVLNNMGDGFAGQDAYAAGAANRAKMIAIDSATETGRDKITFNATTFNGALHNSPGQRFFITSGPVSYGWDLPRRSPGIGITRQDPISSRWQRSRRRSPVAARD